MTRFRIVAAILGVTLVLSACGSSDDSSSGSKEPTSLTVYAPGALKPVVEQLAQTYESDNPQTTVTVTAQDQAGLTAAVTKGNAGVAILPDAWLPTGSQGLDGGSLGLNRITIAVPTDNPGKVTDATAFAKDKGLRTIGCAPDAAAKGFLSLVLAKAGVTPDETTLELGCGSESLTKLAAGELDAALLFRAGLVVPDGVELINIPDNKNVVIKVSYLVLGDAEVPQKFGEFLTSDAAKEILTERGYLP